MLCRVTEGLPSSPPRVTVAVVVMMVIQADPATTTFLQRLTEEELVLSVIVNQMAILRIMNESSSLCAREVDAHLEQGMSELRAMNEQMLETKMQAMNDQVMSKLHGLEETVNTTVEAMDVQISMIENVTTNIKEVEQTTAVVHNIPRMSLCVGHKELHETEGLLNSNWSVLQLTDVPGGDAAGGNPSCIRMD
ncbi:uncharacterized protein LOC123509879 [Portunus trituberculatus]|uniref:uncharacterized protein LOC123509879 n=1 Tax=Portunus trituberculatus TaxID=210409 RepID=UPI001E1D0F39|nr:uncharacterized protein LOC123509879 [Portunus trituberculatus]